MKAAFALWNQRVAPVFDVAHQVLVVEAEEHRVVRETREVLPEEDPARKALRLKELGIDQLVCGAISRTLHALVSAQGIRVTSFIAGDLDEIVRAWVTDDLSEDRFAMPGCGGRGRRGQGGGRRRGQGFGGGSPDANDRCWCPACGYETAHERGVPCQSRACPQCGMGLIRK